MFCKFLLIIMLSLLSLEKVELFPLNIEKYHYNMPIKILDLIKKLKTAKRVEDVTKEWPCDLTNGECPILDETDKDDPGKKNDKRKMDHWRYELMRGAGYPKVIFLPADIEQFEAPNFIRK